MPKAQVILKKGREKPLLRNHPWIYSGAIAEIVGKPQCGDIVEVLSSKKDLLGIGAYSHISQIKIRLLTFTNKPLHENPDFSTLLKRRIEKAISSRQQITNTNAYRLCHAESDQLPGLIVDLYNKNAVIQILSCGAESWKEEIAQILISNPAIESVSECFDSEMRNLEGLPIREIIHLGQKITSKIKIEENEIKFLIDINGQKTGFYLDQRENRFRLREYVNKMDVLDCFCYSGGFSLNAAVGGAKSITSVDSANEALEILRENIQLNNFPQETFEIIQADVFSQLRTFRDQDRKFDVIVLDPPKLAPTRKHVDKAARAYKDINLLAFKLLRPGGILFTFSCSGGLDRSLFQKIVADAALDAGVDAQIIGTMSQSSDHPILLSFPEGEYLKGFICRIQD